MTASVRWCRFAAALVVAALIGTTFTFGLSPATAASTDDYFDGFSGRLGDGWVFKDGYADQYPQDTAHHASV